MNARPWRAVVRPCLLLLCALASGRLPAAAAPDTLEVPGGTAAVVRMIGSVDPRPDAFADSLVRVLLTTIPPDHDVSGVPLRADMLAYMSVAGAERRLHGGDVRIVAGAPNSDRMMRGLAAVCGFRPGSGPGSLEPLPEPGSDRRRRAAQALGWNLPRVARQLARGKDVLLPLGEDRVAAPLPLAEWSAIVGRPVSATSALDELVADQRLGLLIEGLRLVPAATRRAFDLDDRRFIYRNAAAAFYRYGGVFDLDGAAAVLPGGAAAAPAWAELAGGVPPADGRAFFRALLARNGARGAYLFSALRGAPARAVAALLREPDALRLLDAALARTGIAFANARSVDAGLGLLLRSLPLADEATPRFDLPYGPGAWLAAARGDAAPSGAEMSAAAFVAGLLDARMEIFGIERPALPVVARAAALLPARAVDAPELVRSIVDGVARFGPALDVLAAVEPPDGAVVDAYLAALRRLDQLDDDRPDQLARIARFEGGAELLRQLVQAGALAPDDAAGRLEAWSRAQLTKRRAVPDPAPFVASVLAALPDPPDGGAGRGQAERRLFAALAGTRQPACFHWAELDYCPGPARDFAARLSAAAEAEGLAPLDAVLVPGIVEKATGALMLPAFMEVLTSPDLPPRTADLVRIGRHGLVRRPGQRKFRIDLSDTPWQATRWSSGADDEAGPRTTGHLGGIPRAVAEIRFRPLAGAGPHMAATTEQARAWYAPALSAPWHRVGADLAGAVVDLERAGASLVSAALADAPDGATLAFVAARIPRARLDHARAGDGRVATSISERVGLAVAALEGDAAGGPRPEVLGAERAVVEAARSAAGKPLRLALADAGAAMPEVDGSRRARLQPWPAYETLAAEGDTAALRERTWLDFRLAVIRYVGRAHLPGAVGADLAQQALADLAERLVLEGERDWEGVVRYVEALDEAYFDERMRRCLKAQVFVVRTS